MTRQSLTELIAGLAVEADDRIVPVYEPDEFIENVESVQTPARIMLPSGEGDEDVLVYPHQGKGDMLWTVKELLLYRPAGEGRGWLDVGYALEAYIDSYATKLREANFNTTTGLCSIAANLQEARFLRGVFTYPTGGVYRYYGVMVTLRIQQFVS